MKPFFFGPADKPLFGIYGPPVDGARRKGAVLVCYPFGPEYLRSHRALRELSHHLTQTGYHTLRFDYYGCGDSSGTTEQGTVEQWIEDIGRGMEELRETSGLTRASLVGLRFGATLAALAGSRSLEMDRLVLWDPVVSGSAYLDELKRRNRAFMLGRARPRDWTETDPPDEVLGAPLPVGLREGIAALDLMTLTRPPARNVLVLSTEAGAGPALLCDHLRHLGAAAEHEHIPSPPLWLRQDQVDRTLVPQGVIQSVAGWLDRSGS